MRVREKSDFIASSSVTIDKKTYAIAYNKLLKPGDKLGGAVFGQLVDINGKPMVNKDGSPNICDKPDFMSLIQTGGKVFMIDQQGTRMNKDFNDKAYPAASGEINIL